MIINVILQIFNTTYAGNKIQMWKYIKRNERCNIMELCDIEEFLDCTMEKYTVKQKLELIDDKLQEAIREDETDYAQLFNILYDIFNDNDKNVEKKLQNLTLKDGNVDNLLELIVKGIYYQKKGQKNYESTYLEKSIIYFNTAIENGKRNAYPNCLLARSYRINGFLNKDEDERKKCLVEALNALKKAEECCKENNKLALLYVYSQESSIYLDMHELFKAENIIKKSNELGEYAFQHNVYGNFYRMKGDYNYAIKEYELALKCFKYEKKSNNNDKECVYPLNYIGDCYRYMEVYDKAEGKYIEAIRINLNHPFPWNGLGRVYYELGNRKSNNDEYYQIARDYFDISLSLDKKFGFGYYNYAKVIEKLKGIDKGLEIYEEAKKCPMTQYLEKEVEKHINKIVRQQNIREKIDAIQKKVSEGGEDNQNNNLLLPEEKIVIDTIKENIEKKSIVKKGSFSQMFLKPNYNLEDDDKKSVIELSVLRRWNSYTPIITNGSKGGGYFINAFGKGIVIDPGFNFIDNFKNAGYTFADINTILISHAHDDHTADLESILNLLYRYNKLLKNEKIPKQFAKFSSIAEEQGSKEELDIDKKERFEKYKKILNLYVSENVMEKYEPLISGCKVEDKTDNENTEEKNYKMNIIKPGEFIEEIEENRNVKITALKAKHKDIIGQNGALGFKLDFNNITIIYTGDTGWSKELEIQYSKVKEECKNNYKVLVAHIGGFKEEESEILDIIDVNELGEKNRRNIAIESENQDKYLYDYHLGRIGLAKINKILQPDICIISEFGEEFKEARVKITNIFKEAFKDSKTIFIPADIGLKFNISEKKIKAINKIDRENSKIIYEYIEPEHVKVGEFFKTNQLFYYEDDSNINENDCLQALSEGFSEEKDEICMTNKHKYLLNLFNVGSGF